MLDMNVIRSEPDRVRQTLADRHMDADVDGLLALDTRRRDLITKAEALKAERNANSKRVAELFASEKSTPTSPPAVSRPPESPPAEEASGSLGGKRIGKVPPAARKPKDSPDRRRQGEVPRAVSPPGKPVRSAAVLDLIARTKALAEEIKGIDAELRVVETEVQEIMLTVPNIPAEDVPVGGAEANREVKHWGERKSFDFAPKPHWEIGEALDILDFPRATKIAEPHFSLFKGAGARLVRGLMNFMLDLHTTQHGYTEICPPYLVNSRAMTGTGQLPKFDDEMYRSRADDLYLIPTAEVPLTNMLADEILNEGDLPICYTAYSACFRREAGSYGADTRALMRVHQFDKVEMVKFVRPEDSWDELEKLRANAERVIELLGLEYRVLVLATGDLSFAAAKCYDIEIWSPGMGRWLETSSCSNFLDFQARRANIRYRDLERKVRFIHTLNGSGVAFARLIAALLETWQNADGSVTIPPALVPHMGGMEKIEKT